MGQGSGQGPGRDSGGRLMIKHLRPDQLVDCLGFGEICLVPGDESILGEAIRIGQSMESGGVAVFGHAMIHAGDGALISPEEKVVKKDLIDFQGRTLRFWWPPAWERWPEGNDDSENLMQISDDAYLQIGRRYDYLGLIGQAVRGVFVRWGMQKIGDWLAGVIQWPSRWFCSEMVSYLYRRHYPDFCGGNKQPSPQDIDDWCTKIGWESMTVKVKAAGSA